MTAVRASRLLAAIVAALLAPTAAAADTAGGARELQAAHRSGPVRLDGRLDEPAWQAAPAGDGFIQLAPDEGARATLATRVRVLWDESSLYFGIECDDPDGPTALLNRRDRQVEADSVSIILDTTLDRRTAYHFTVFAAGQQLDGMHSDDTSFATEWDGAWESAVSRDARGWSVELGIPLRLLRIPDGASAMGLDVVRTVARRHEESHWQFTPRGTPGLVSRLGRLAGLDGIRPAGWLDLKPYLSMRGALASPAPAASSAPLRLGGCASGGLSASATASLCAGLDLRARLTSDLALVGTLNPDFGNVEVDQRVLNLSTFETFFPEKRGFFLEGLELFSPPVRMTDWGGQYGGDAFQLFYSRRVGRALPAPVLPPGEALLFQLAAQPVAGAVKLVGNVGPASVALLSALEPRVRAQIADPSGASLEPLVADAVHSAALRARVPAGAHAIVGATATARDPLDAPGARHSHAGALDVAAFDAERDWTFAAQLAGSLLTGGPREVQPDGTVLDSGASGGALSAKLSRDGGWLTGFVDADWISPRFEVNGLGYQRRGNLFRSFAAVALKDLHPSARWQKAQVTLSGREIHDAAFSTLLYRDVVVQPEITFGNFWSFVGDLVVIAARADDRELGDGTPLAQRGGWGAVGVLGSDPNRAFSAQLGGSRLQYGPGSDQLLFVAATVRPATRLEAQAEVDLSDVRGEIRRIRTATTVPAPDAPPAPLDPESAVARERLYLFAPQSVRSISAWLRATLALSPRLTLQAYTQLFTAGITYGAPLRALAPPGRAPIDVASLAPALPEDEAPVLDTRQAAVDVNLILRWEWRLGSAFYLVYGHHSEGGAMASRSGLSVWDDLGLLGAGAARGDSLMLKLDLLVP